MPTVSQLVVKTSTCEKFQPKKATSASWGVFLNPNFNSSFFVEGCGWYCRLNFPIFSRKNLPTSNISSDGDQHRVPNQQKWQQRPTKYKSPWISETMAWQTHIRNLDQSPFPCGHMLSLLVDSPTNKCSKGYWIAAGHLQEIQVSCESLSLSSHSPPALFRDSQGGAIQNLPNQNSHTFHGKQLNAISLLTQYHLLLP